jgi:hypothetical protein
LAASLLSNPALPDLPETATEYDRNLRRSLDEIRRNIAATNQALNIPVFSVNRDGAQQTIPDITSTVVEFDTAALDTHAGFDAANFRYQAIIAGWYLCKAQVRWGLNTGPLATSHRLLKIQKNDASSEDARLAVMYPGTANTSPTLAVESMLYLTIGDYVDVAVYQDAGGDRLIEGEPTQTFFHGYKVAD